MNKLEFKEGQTYICTESHSPWWTVGKEYPVFLDSDNEPVIKDDDGDKRYSSYIRTFNNQFKLKEEQPKVTLDEPQKPVIPQLVAGWLEKSTDPFTKAEKIAYLIKSKDGDSYYFCDWFVQDGILTQEQGEELLAWAIRQSYETLLSLYNGYEVEKEPLYEVIIGDLYLIKKFKYRNEFCFDTKRSLCAWEKSAYQLTEAEIKAIDERFWPFAVPVWKRWRKDE
ncbi:DUF1642 domain-containing protein [Enterococcus faecium]|nr:DUF1642 domain-containing protein [Enterococcus faecium]